MNNLFKQLFERKDKRFIREVDELLNSGECSIDSEMILQTGKRKVQIEKEYYLEGEKYVRYGLGQLLLNPDKILTNGEREYLHKLQGRAGGKSHGGGFGGGPTVSIDKIKENIEKASCEVKN